MANCSKCNSPNGVKRVDLIGDPSLCDECYSIEIYGEVNCDACKHSYYEGDKMRCNKEKCEPAYQV